METKKSMKLRQGYCPDPFCNERLLIEDDCHRTIECFYCDQDFFKNDLNDITSIDCMNGERLRKRIAIIPKRKGSEWVRIRGLSPFYCKIISPMFTMYGIDNVGKARLLGQISKDEYFDCSTLAKYAFEIEEDDFETYGYGLDSSGSSSYLLQTLSLIDEMNGREMTLLPLHVGGDGSCLVHAISRALVGREIYWHPLREGLRRHLTSNEEWYKKTLGEFIADDDWQEIVKECDTYYVPRDDRLGLRTAHVFALANILRKPIILLDVPENIKIGADFSAIFLPVLHNIDECKDENGELYKPVVIAWANKAHSHFVPLVSMKGSPSPRLWRSFLPKAWCVEDDKTEQYISFENGHCIVSTGVSFSESDIQKMIKAMDLEYTNQIKISPRFLCDYFEDVLYDRKFSLPDNERLAQVLKESNEGKLWRCMICWRLNKRPHLSSGLLQVGGYIYEKVVKMTKGKLEDRKIYTFDPLGTFEYNLNSNSFSPCIIKLRKCHRCEMEKGQMRLQFSDGLIRYYNGDHSRNPAPEAMCKRKMKHIWNSLEYDNAPFTGELKFRHNGIDIKAEFKWFAFESDVHRNSSYDLVTDKIMETLFTDEPYSDELRTLVYSLVVKKVNSFAMDDDCLCKDPCWLLDSDDELKDYSNSTNELPSDNGGFADDYRSSLKSQASFLLVTCSDDIKMAIEWDETFTYDDLLSHICQSGLIVSSQVESISFGNPSVQLQKEQYPLPLKSGMELNVNIIRDNNEHRKNIFQPGIEQKSLTECSLVTKVLIQSLHLKYDEYVGSNNFWLMLEMSPQLFQSDGVFYRMIIEQFGFQEGKHYSLPAFLPNKVLVYNLEKNRLDLCVVAVGHFEIKESIRSAIADVMKTHQEKSKVLESFDVPAQKSDATVTTVIVVPSCDT